MRVALFLLVVLYALPAVGQECSMSGTVTSDDGPVAGATVTLLGINKKYVTDGEGKFRSGILPCVRYRVSVSCVGCEPVERDVFANSNPVFQLKQRTGGLDEVVVSGTMKPVRRLESPVAVEVYSSLHFRKNPTPSLFESMGSVNGVRPQINCSVCNTGDIHINGLEGPYTMVTIDGMPIVSSLGTVYGLFGIPSQLLEKVEVIKGPASGLYGSEAIGGLINVITKDPAKAPKLSFNAMTTSWREHSLDGGFRIRAGKSAALTGIHYFYYGNPVDHNGDNFTDVTLQHRVSVFQKWRIHRAANRVLTLAGRYFYEDRWGGEMQWERKFRGGDSVYGESIYTSRWELLGRYQLPVKGQWYFSFSATGHHQNAAYGVNPFVGDQRILFGQLTNTQLLGKGHELLTGIVGRHTDYDDNSTATRDTLTGANHPERTFLPGIFLQEEWTISPKHTLLLGLRWDHHPVHRSIWTPRIAWRWKLPANQVFRLNAGTGFRVVSLFTEEHAALTGARAVVVPDALQPETSYNVNFNYTLPMGRAGRSVTLDASAWYTYFNNRIVADYDTDPQSIIFGNLDGHALSRGISVALEGNYRNRLRGNIGVTLQDVATVTRAAGGKLEKRRPVLSENWSGTWSISYSIPTSGWTFDYTGNVYGPMRLPLLSARDPRKPFSPVWSIQNLQVTKWISNRIEVYGGVKNLLDWTPVRGNPFLIARASDPFDKRINDPADNPYGLSFDPSYVYAPNQGRRVFLGVRLKWE